MSDNFKRAVEFLTSRLSQLVDLNLIEIAERKGKYLQLGIIPENVNWSSLVQKSKSNSEIFKALKLYCSEARLRGEQLDPSLEQWLADYLNELIHEPPRRKGAPEKSFGRDYFLWLLIDTASKKFNLTVSRNQEGKETSVCDALSLAINYVNKSADKKRQVKPTSFNELRQLYWRSSKIFKVNSLRFESSILGKGLM